MRRALALLLALLAWTLAGFSLSDVLLRWTQLEAPHRRLSAALFLPVALLVLVGAIVLSAWVWRNWGPLGGEGREGEGRGPISRG